MISDIALVLSTLMCSLIAGLLFCYAILIMPGLKKLDDKSFIKAFQVTDRIIQNNHPLFILIWLGSALSIIVLAISSLGKLEGIDVYIMLFALTGYFCGIQAPTILVNLPLNKKLQKLNVAHSSEEELRASRIEFEAPWNKSNEIRTIMACMTSLALIVLCLKQ
ncbi:DUF1772 domain-containing protein [Catenovulum sp. SM1970]|uniref:anthrone oxygenase family protein n=1 Tax=Marinifaba aquimaris TaxID=2741323 RepID=UPI0015724C0F|nr:anthrone oxygenase family protein [Marinifaba aquimaris]NTS77114.1 DUF1772 domain-containing protein [Marinifaba aquimaris]